MKIDSQTDQTRRKLGVAILGALGSAAFIDAQIANARVNESSEHNTGIAQALSKGTDLAYVDTVLDLPLPKPPEVRTKGDLATQTPNELSATVVIAKGCTVPGDGGGGVFYWAESGIDDGGTVIVPRANIGASGGCWKRICSGPLNVKWFGARGDGKTDDQRAIQAAINAAWAVGGVIFFDSGEYVCSRTLVLPTDSNSTVALVGSGAGGPAHLVDPHGTRLMFTAQDGSDFISAISTNFQILTYRFENLAIYGPGAMSLVTNGSGIRISGGAVSRVSMSNVVVRFFSGGNGIWLDNCEDSTLRDVFISKCQTGLRLTNDFNANALINVGVEDCSEYGIYAEGSASVALIGCLVQSNERTGFKGVGLIDWVVSATHFENNNKAAADVYAVDIESAENLSVQHLKFDNCTFWSPASRENIILRPGWGLMVDVSFSGYANGIEPAITVDQTSNGYVKGLYVHEFCPASAISDPGGKISGLQLWVYGEHVIG